VVSSKGDLEVTELGVIELWFPEFWVIELWTPAVSPVLFFWTPPLVEDLECQRGRKKGREERGVST
jgi:hypothetical protein